MSSWCCVRQFISLRAFSSLFPPWSSERKRAEKFLFWGRRGITIKLNYYCRRPFHKSFASLALDSGGVAKCLRGKFTFRLQPIKRIWVNSPSASPPRATLEEWNINVLKSHSFKQLKGTFGFALARLSFALFLWWFREESSRPVSESRDAFTSGKFIVSTIFKNVVALENLVLIKSQAIVCRKPGGGDGWAVMKHNNRHEEWQVYWGTSSQLI